MEVRHFLYIAALLAAGYVIGRIWATPATMVGLP